MAQPVWVTPAGDLGTIPEGVFYQTPLEAYDPGLDTVYYSLLAGSLPAGMFINDSGLLVGVPQAQVFVQGTPEQVSRDVTSKFAVRAYTQQTIHGVTVINRLADRTFEITVSGQDAPEFITPAGQIAEIYDGSLFDFQIQYTDVDPDDTVTVRLVSGQLPLGLSINAQGKISGFVLPNAPIDATGGYSRDGQGYDAYPYDFTTQSFNTNYEFTLEVTDGKVGGNSLRTFSIFVYSRTTISADTTQITADNTFVTADEVDYYLPVILTPPGSIGRVRNDNWFAFKFDAIDIDGPPTQWLVTDSSPGPLSEIGLQLDLNTGWLYGAIPYLGLTDQTYTFTVVAFQKEDYANRGAPVTFSLQVIGPADNEVVWITPSNLGTIDNGAISTLYVEAQVASGASLLYELASGSDSLLPQGLQLLPNGLIAGRVSFNTFALDGGTTIFDQDTTTFDLKNTFTVRAYSADGLVDVTKTFSVTVIRRYNEPFDNLYIQAMPPQDDRVLLNSLLQNSEIFPTDLIYRPSDPYFGVAKNVTYYHAYGLTAATLLDYVNSLNLNHYWKNLVLGEIEVAQARNSAGEVIYEAVYSRIIDNLVNDARQSVSKEVTLPYLINAGDSTEIERVYPNSLINMRDQVIDTVGQVSNVLPAWMTSKQSDGRVLGFQPAWVIAYAKPGQGKRIAYYIAEKFGVKLNLVDYEVDRYELDRFLSHNWDPVTDSWTPPPAETTFDYPADPPLTNKFGTWGNYNNTYTVFTPVQWVNGDGNIITWTNTYNGEQTIFDGNSLKFIAPVDMYVGTLPNPQVYDKYLVFPKRNILE